MDKRDDYVMLSNYLFLGVEMKKCLLWFKTDILIQVLRIIINKVKGTQSYKCKNQ